MNPQTITLKINGKDATVSKLPLRRIAEVFKALDQLPKKFSDLKFDQLSNDQFFEMLPSIIGDSLPELAKVVAVASSLTEEEVLDECGLADITEVVQAIFEVNDMSRVVENVKKLIARKPGKANKLPTTGSTEQLTS